MRHNLNVMAQTVEIKVSKHHATFLLGISEIRRDKRFFDIKLCVGDEEIDSHKAVLATFSPYFSDYFDDAFLNNGQDRIDLTDNTNMAVLTSILDYMYSGSISFLIEDGAMLMRTLDFFKMQSVTDLCETYLVENITARNYVALFNLAEEVLLERLKEAAVHYIYKNFRGIHGSNEFKKLTKDQLESVIQKTRDRDAETAYEAIVGWIEYDTLNRKDCVEQLLKYVSIQHLTASYYWKNIRRDNFLKNDAAGCRWLVNSFLDHPESPFWSYQTLHILSTSHNSNYKWDVREKSLTTLESRPNLNGCAMVKHDKSIYAFGKGDGNKSIGIKYDTTTKWTRVVAGNILIKHSPGICSHGDGIYLIGGEENNQRQRTCIRYDVETSQWTTLPEMKNPRSSPGVVSCNSSIYVFGGYSHQPYGYYANYDTTHVERYDPREGKWLEQSPINLQLSVSSAVVSEYNVCCFQCNSDKLINFDTRSGQTNNVTSNNFTMGTSLASLDGRLYIAHAKGIAEHNPYEMKWNGILQKPLNTPVLIA